MVARTAQRPQQGVLGGQPAGEREAASALLDRRERQLERGARLTELLKQPQYSPYPVEEQVVSIWAGTNGKLDTIEVEDVLRF